MRRLKLVNACGALLAEISERRGALLAEISERCGVLLAEISERPRRIVG
ncbi:MAG TPA: hypothetical protein VLB46_08050 [Pyrinomonadaceae bacterium]|nr:hypothetical protein [Pyrinomonadaceae bacterium]